MQHKRTENICICNILYLSNKTNQIRRNWQVTVVRAFPPLLFQKQQNSERLPPWKSPRYDASRDLLVEIRNTYTVIKIRFPRLSSFQRPKVYHWVAKQHRLYHVKQTHFIALTWKSQYTTPKTT